MQIRPTPYQLQIKIFEKYGCIYSRTKGDHMVYHYPGSVRPVVIPKYKEVPAFVIIDHEKKWYLPKVSYSCSFAFIRGSGV